MDTLVLVGGLCLFCCLSPVLFWGFDRLRAQRAMRRHAWRRGAPASDLSARLTRDRPSLETLVADLQRLELQYQRINATNPPAKMQRLRAVSLAYDDVLGECCSALGLPPPLERPLSAAQRLITESELALRGLTW